MKLLSTLFREGLSQKTPRFRGPKQSSRQFTNELFLEERSSLRPKASSMAGTRVLCWVVGDGVGAEEVDWALSEPVHDSDLVLPPCGLLGDKTSSVPAHSRLPELWTSAGKEGTEWGFFSLARAKGAANILWLPGTTWLGWSSHGPLGSVMLVVCTLSTLALFRGFETCVHQNLRALVTMLILRPWLPPLPSTQSLSQEVRVTAQEPAYVTRSQVTGARFFFH